MTLLFLYLFIAIGVSFICSVLEAVLLSISPSYVETVRKKDATKGEALAKVKNNLEHSISCILILNTFAHTMGAAGVGAQALQLFGPQWETLIAVSLTLAILYLSEIIPKTLGATYWRSLAYPSAKLISFLIKLVYPLVWLSGYITRIFRSKDANSISREEIRAFTTLGYEGGALAKQESQLLGNILGLRERSTQQILTPRTVVHAFEQASTINQALDAEMTPRFTRFPVYQGNIDNIVGVINHRTLSEQLRQGQGDSALVNWVQPVHRVSEKLPCLQLLDLFISRKEHLFIVEDHYGQTAGIVSLEDVIETLLGREIVDETDVVEDMQLLAKSRFRDRLRRNNKLSE